MASLPVEKDPTLDALRLAMVLQSNDQPPRGYLGMSSIADECDRKLWYQWRWFADNNFDAETLARFADGHYSEDVVADRLRLVDGVELITHIDAKQIGFSDIEAHFRGHMDGKILGLLQAKKTWHVWEHKCVNEQKFAKMQKLKQELGEKNALAKWDEVYYGQAVLYMHYSGLTRHYLTVSTSGSREITSCRTEPNPELANELIAKAESIICTDKPPKKMATDPSFYKCKWCSFSEVCHFDQAPKRTCRSCRHSFPAKNGAWQCNFYRADIPESYQIKGCDEWSSLV